MAVLVLVWCKAKAQRPVKCPPAPLSEAQVVELVRERVQERRMVKIVRACGVGFTVNNQALDTLRAVGLSQPVLNVLREAAHRLATPVKRSSVPPIQVEAPPPPPPPLQRVRVGG